MNCENKVRGLLKDYSLLKLSIRNMKDEIKIIDEELYELKASIYTEKISNNSISNSFETKIINLIEEKNILKRYIIKTQNNIDKIDLSLSKLKSLEKQVIKLKYFKGYNIYKISEELNYSESYILKVTTIAFKKIVKSLYGYLK